MADKYDPVLNLREAYEHVKTAVDSLDNPSRKLKKAVKEAEKSVKKVEERTK